MFYLSICAIFKTENPWLREFIDYHYARGVEHFYLFNNEAEPDEAGQILQPYVDQGLVEHLHLPGPRKYRAAYMAGAILSAGQSFWTAFIDIDEFILPRQCDDIRQILKYYEEFSGLTMNWRIFGSSGLKTRPHSQLESFVHRAVDDCEANYHIKTIARPEKIARFINPHYPIYKEETSFSVNEDYERVNGPFDMQCKANKIRVNHYIVRSYQDFVEVKQPRGRATVSENRSFQFFSDHDRNEVYDDEIWRRFGNRIIV